MSKTYVEVDFPAIEVEVTYSLSGEHLPATETDPEANVEIELEKFVVDFFGKPVEVSVDNLPDEVLDAIYGAIAEEEGIE